MALTLHFSLSDPVDKVEDAPNLLGNGPFRLQVIKMGMAGVGF